MASTFRDSETLETMVRYETTLPVRTTPRLIAVLEASGLRAGSDFDLVFSPERVESRLVLRRLTENPRSWVGSRLPPRSVPVADAEYADLDFASLARRGPALCRWSPPLAGGARPGRRHRRCGPRPPERRPHG